MTFADQARQAARMLSRNGLKPVSRQDLGDRLGIQSRKDMRRVDNAVDALVKSGDLERQGKGFYRYIGQALQPGKQKVMWLYLRARRSVTAAELQEVAGAAADTVLDWLRLLVKLKVVRREIPPSPPLGKGGEIKGAPAGTPAPLDAHSTYRLIQDPGPEPPRNESRAESQHRWYQKKKQALAKLDEAFVAVAEARLAVSQLEEQPHVHD